MKLAKKSLGQNFLTDHNVIKKILKLVNLKNKNIIEIGPGYGALTELIIKNNPRKLFLIEKDEYLAKKLSLKYSNNKNITIFNSDILKFDLEKNILKNSIIFGNLPYNISSQILVKIIKFKKWPPKYNDLVLMFQKELGEKILGFFETKNYGRLSILSNYRLNNIGKFLVSPNSFFPKPKVTSMVIHFKPKKRISHKIRNLENLEKITNIFFSNKRKMINKNIKKIFSSIEISKMTFLDLNLRPEKIRPDLYYKITELFEKKRKSFFC